MIGLARSCFVTSILALAVPLFLSAPGTARAQCALNLASGATTTLSNGAYSFCSMNVSAGATLFIGGSVTVNMTGDVDIEGVVTGAGLGYGSLYNGSPGPGAGGAGTTVNGGAGGGHGGDGGSGLVACSTGSLYSPPGCSTLTGPNPAGLAYDSFLNPTWMGSAGGASGGATYVAGGAGGAALVLSAPSNNVTINGTIDMSGSSPLVPNVNPEAGGGAGGTISIDAQGVFGSGTLAAKGGVGGTSGFSLGAGAGGGGGRVRLCVSGAPPAGFTGTVVVTGGPGGYGGALCGLVCTSWNGASGQDGSYFFCGPTYTPTQTFTPVNTPTCILCFYTSTFTPTVTPTLSDTPTPSPTVSLTVTPTTTPSPTPLPCPPGYTGPQPPGPGECFTYPAPASGSLVHFVYSMSEAGRAQILVRNERGDLLADLSQDQDCGVQQTDLALGRFAAGVYFYQVNLFNGSGQEEKLKLHKFLVQR